VSAIALCTVLSSCSGSRDPQLLVSAAASLRQAFPRYAHGLRGETIRFSFAGSDALAAQVASGARPDVFASANAQLPQQLYARGLLERPVAFAANQLVLAVPAGSPARAFDEVARPGVTLAIGTPTVPVGAYALQALSRLPAVERRVLTRDLRDREPDVLGIVAKVAEGAVDGGFVYRTDVAASDGRIRALALPAGAQPDVEYEAAVVKGAAQPARARAFIAGLLVGAGRDALLRAGFLPPVRRARVVFGATR
jgi:molybdate transport system substrate-binding protein